MELNITLTLVKGPYLPINYQYELSSWIYKVIERADSEYSNFLHNEGFQSDGKQFRMFTFSQVDFRPYEIQGDKIKLLGKKVSFIVRFAVDSSMEHFIKGLFMQQQFMLGDKSTRVDFEVTGVETIAPPTFQTVMKYQCLSSICVSRLRDDHTTEYLSPEAVGYGKLLVQNLMRKSSALVSTTRNSEALPDFQFRLLNTPRKKGVHIKVNTSAHTQVVGYLFHFELTAPVELQELGYDAGFGEKNSMGFGCVELLKVQKDD